MFLQLRLRVLSHFAQFRLVHGAVSSRNLVYEQVAVQMVRFVLNAAAKEPVAIMQFLRFAENTGVDVNSAIENASMSMKAFNVDSSEAGNVLGMFQTVAQNTGIDVSTLMNDVNANGATLLESLKLGCAGYSGVMANFHTHLFAWLCANYEKEPEKAEKLMNFLGAASTIECQCYPVNAKYHMNLVGVPMSLVTRSKDPALFTSSRRLEIDQFYVCEKMFEEYILK